jgi:PTS system mannose-specific IIC component
VILPFEPSVLLGLLGWGTLVGLDLVSVPQMMISRPLVAGTIAGAIAGDVASGMRVGLLLELFSLDVLAVGAARYPDYGPATVAATAYAALSPATWEAVVGPAALLGLLLARLGGWTLPLLRHANARVVQLHSAELATGDPERITAIHWLSLIRDATRSFALTALGLLLVVFWLRIPTSNQWLPAIAAVGAGMAAAWSGALRTAGRGPRLTWVGAGALAGMLWVAWSR